jgi:predicted DNA repair protein MutK
MPVLLRWLAIIGTVAMLWVGGHILLVGADTLGWHGPYALVHHAEEAVAAAVSVGSGALAWLTNTLGSAIAGLIVGAVVVLIMHLIPRKKDAANAAH